MKASRTLPAAAALAGTVVLGLPLVMTSASADAPLYGTATTYPNGSLGVGIGPDTVAAADVDGDGSRDLAVVDATAGAVRILLNDGLGTFGSPVSYRTGAGTTSVEAADLDGDTALDLVVTNGLAGTWSILFNQGDGTFAKPVNRLVGPTPTDAVVADFDNNGSPDFAVSTYAGPIQIYLNDGSGHFTFARRMTAGPWVMVLRAADIDGDGNVDLVANSWVDGLWVYRGLGDGTFQGNGIVPLLAGVEDFELTDVTGDAHADLVAANIGTNSVRVFPGTGTGKFDTPAIISTVNPEQTAPLGWTVPNALDVADLDGDGDPDLIVAGDFDKTGYAMLGDGTGHFITVQSIATPSDLRTVRAADLNGDARLDLVLANSGPSFHVLLNLG